GIDPCGSRQMCMQACPLGSLPAGIKGKFSKKIPYRKLMRTGETRNLYLLFFTEKRIVILHKAGFCKGTLPELKAFVRKRRTLHSKLYGLLRWLPVIFALALNLWLLSSEF
ncbi:MAG: YcxB family protein, partial [Lachnospiraceae bacterium]|nr:YcxB family protein [Lachnospiraceae bacterium]